MCVVLSRLMALFQLGGSLFLAQTLHGHWRVLNCTPCWNVVCKHGNSTHLHNLTHEINQSIKRDDTNTHTQCQYGSVYVAEISKWSEVPTKNVSPVCTRHYYLSPVGFENRLPLTSNGWIPIFSRNCHEFGGKSSLDDTISNVPKLNHMTSPCLIKSPWSWWKSPLANDQPPKSSNIMCWVYCKIPWQLWQLGSLTNICLSYPKLILFLFPKIIMCLVLNSLIHSHTISLDLCCSHFTVW